MDAQRKKYKRGEYPELIPDKAGKISLFPKRGANILPAKKYVSNSKTLPRTENQLVHIPQEYWVMAIAWCKQNFKLINTVYNKYLRLDGVNREDWREEIHNLLIRDVARLHIKYNPSFGKSLNGWIIQGIFLFVRAWKAAKLQDLFQHESLTNITKDYEQSKQELVSYTELNEYGCSTNKPIPVLVQATRIFLKDVLHPADYKLYELLVIEGYAEKIIAKYLDVHRTAMNKKKTMIANLIIANRQKIEEIEVKLINGEIIYGES